MDTSVRLRQEAATLGIEVSFVTSWEEDWYPSPFSKAQRTTTWSCNLFSSCRICTEWWSKLQQHYMRLNAYRNTGPTHAISKNTNQLCIFWNIVLWYRHVLIPHAESKFFGFECNETYKLWIDIRVLFLYLLPQCILNFGARQLFLLGLDIVLQMPHILFTNKTPK